RSQRYDENMNVQLEVGFRRQDACGHDGKDRAQQSHAESDSKRSADQSQNQALREKLIENLSATGSPRASNRNFPQSRRSLRQQQIRDIDARNYQHESHRAQKQPQVADALARKEIILQLFDRRARPFIRVRIGGGSVRRASIHIGSRLLNRDTWFEPAHRQQPVVIVINLFGAESQRRHQFKIKTVANPRRQYSDHGIGFAVDAHWLANDCLIRTQVVPKFVRQNDCVIAARYPFLGTEVPSHQERQPLHIEKSGRTAHAVELLGLFLSRHIETSASPRPQLLKGFVLLLPVEKVSRGHTVVVPVY